MVKSQAEDVKQDIKRRWLQQTVGSLWNYHWRRQKISTAHNGSIWYSGRSCKSTQASEALIHTLMVFLVLVQKITKSSYDITLFFCRLIHKLQSQYICQWPLDPPPLVSYVPLSVAQEKIPNYESLPEIPQLVCVALLFIQAKECR